MIYFLWGLIRYSFLLLPSRLRISYEYCTFPVTQQESWPLASDGVEGHPRRHRDPSGLPCLEQRAQTQRSFPRDPNGNIPVY